MKAFLISITVSILLPVAVAQGEETATMTGRVVDPQHRVIAHASIALEGPRSAATATDETGDFSLHKLPPGAYHVTIRATGFARAEQSVELHAANVRLYIQLSIATAEESVTVSAQEADTQDTLDVSEIRQSSAKDVGEALSAIDGLWKIRKGGIGNDVVLRGLQRDNVNVLIDGSRIYGACLRAPPYWEPTSAGQLKSCVISRCRGMPAHPPSTAINRITVLLRVGCFYDKTPQPLGPGWITSSKLPTRNITNFVEPLQH